MTGHTFVYNSAVRYVKKLIDAGELGELRYIYSQRLNLGRIRSDIDALWNFAPHDSASFNTGWASRNRSPLAARAWLTCRKGSTTLFSLISSIPREDHRKHSRQLVGPAESAKDDYRRFTQDGGLR